MSLSSFFRFPDDSIQPVSFTREIGGFRRKIYWIRPGFSRNLCHRIPKRVLLSNLQKHHIEQFEKASTADSDNFRTLDNPGSHWRERVATPSQAPKLDKTLLRSIFTDHFYQQKRANDVQHTNKTVG